MSNRTRNPRWRPRLSIETLEQRDVPAGFLTKALPYLQPTVPAVTVKPLLTVGESVPETGSPTATYQMAGIPDGMGAFDNGDGTFTLLVNHEIVGTRGGVRDHGSIGSFVSKWIIEKDGLGVVSGDDLIKQVQVWDTTTNAFIPAAGAVNAISRLCSADLPEVSAFFNAATGLGTSSRIFMHGEETTSGRAFASFVTGPDAGIAYELPWTGRYPWENHVASPFAQDKTVVIGLDDANRGFSSEGATDPSEVFIWVGNKQNTGTELEKAGLRNGGLFGLKVGTPGNYDANESTVTNGERFELYAFSDQTANTTATPLQAEAIANSVTQFRRVEDGAFDPNNPNDFYFVTTDQF